jgi:hypothetical protein
MRGLRKPLLKSSLASKNRLKNTMTWFDAQALSLPGHKERNMTAPTKTVYSGMVFHLDGKQSRLLPDVGGTLVEKDHIETIEGVREACQQSPDVTDWMLFKHRIFTRPSDGQWLTETTELVESTIPRD